MSVIWYKVWFDIWQRKSRTALTVFSIAAGVFAIGTIFGMVDQLLSTMDASHLATNPSHLNVVLGVRTTAETAETLTKIEGVTGVETLNLLSGRYRLTPEEPWQSAVFVMRQDFAQQTYDLMSLVAGEWPNKKEVAIERLSSNYFGLNIGDEVFFELDGTDRTFAITGLIRHPFVPPPDFGGDTYFLVSEDVMAQLGVPKGQYNQILVQIEPYSDAYAKDIAIEIKEHLQKLDVPVGVILYQEPEEHWGRPFVMGVTFVLQVLAVVSLLASVILVINTMTAIITQQTDQIGVIKAIGGTAGLIVRIYLAGVFVYGILATFIALPLGMLSGYLGSKWLLNLFNIDYETFQFSWYAVSLQIFSALIAPLLAALWPVLSGAAISVREAIASYGLGGDFGFNPFDRLIEKIGERFLSSPYAIALGNMFRRKGRLLLTQGVLILAGTMFLMVMTLSNSVTVTLETELNRRGYDVRLAFPRSERADDMVATALRVPGVATAEAWFTTPASVSIEGQRIEETAELGAELFAVPAGSKMYNPNIVEGRWLTPEDKGYVVVISRDTADFNNLQVGDFLTLDVGTAFNAEWQVIGIYQAIAPEPFSTDPIYAPAEVVIHETKEMNQARQLLIRSQTNSPAETALIMTTLQNELERRSIPLNMFVTRTVFEEREYAYNQFGIITSLLVSLAAVMAMVGGIGLMGSLSISVVERTREIGVLRAIGAENRDIMGMFVMEGVLQGVISWAISAPLAFVAARPMALALGQIMLKTNLDFAFSYLALALWFLLVVVIAILASVVPAYSATQISVRESLAYG